MSTNPLLAAIASLALLGCEALPAVSAQRLLDRTDPVRVAGSNERGDVLEVELESDRSSAIHAYFPADDSCRALLAPGTELDWSSSGLGSVRLAGSQCEAIGSATLSQLIDARPPIRIAKPRETARWEAGYADAEVRMLRGQFPLYARVLGISADDITTVIPATPPCPSIADLGEAAMEYDRRTKRFSLLRGEDRCEIRGIIQQR